MFGVVPLSDIQDQAKPVSAKLSRNSSLLLAEVLPGKGYEESFWIVKMFCILI